jgi:hypothetical protein
VQSGPIDPQTGLPIQQQPGQLPPPQPGEQTAALDPNSPPPAQPMPPPVGAEPISREGMAGTWTVASDNPECRIILAFTKWSGGYRAATRRCNTPELAAVTAWDVKGSQVVLVDANGSNVATLVSAGPEQYQGQTTGGKPIQFTR